MFSSNSADISSTAIQLFLISCHAKSRRNTISVGQPAIVPFARVKYQRARNAFTSEIAKTNAHRWVVQESSTEGKQWRRLWKYDCRELLRDLGRCVLPLNQLNQKHDVQQRATGSVVFVSKLMRFLRKNTQPGHVHLLCQIDIDSSRQMTHAHRNMLIIWQTDQNLSTKAGL